MPYGQYSPFVPRPLVSSTVPLACKLSPLHPGYVITVCAEAVVRKESSASAQVVNDDSIVDLDAVYFRHDAPGPRGLVGMDSLQGYSFQELREVGAMHGSEMELRSSIPLRSGHCCARLTTRW